jgi:hypothetical protein
MCFWFGLEILRLVNKKVFFKILNGFYLLYQKKRNFALISKMRKSLVFCQREKNFTEKPNF